MSSRNEKLIDALKAELTSKRRAIGLSQERLALEAGVNRTYVAKIELGTNQPTLTVLDKLACGLKLTLPELIQDVFNRYLEVEPTGPTIKSVSSYLDKLILKGDVITYYELYEHFGIPQYDYLNKNNPIPRLLGGIASEDRKDRRPIRTSVVVRMDKCKDKFKRVPSDKYFETLCEYRKKSTPKTKDERRILHQEEMKKLNAYYLKHY